MFGAYVVRSFRYLKTLILFFRHRTNVRCQNVNRAVNNHKLDLPSYVQRYIVNGFTLTLYAIYFIASNI